MILVVLSVWMLPVTAQEKLGDLVAQGGYDWVIGRWVATTDQGEKAEFRYEWTLDKHAILVDTILGNFKYRGMIMLMPTDGEIAEIGADNRGGIWKGSWSEDSAGLSHRIEHTNAQGEVRKGDIIHTRVDADTIMIAIYAVDNSGSRNAEPWAKLTYKRQPAATAAASSTSGQAGGSTDYQTLGDLVSQGGYEWMIGKWVAGEGDREYELEQKPILDKHAALMDVKIGDFKYQGIVMCAPARQEITQIGADSFGGIWKGTWSQDPDGAAACRWEYIKADGSTYKLEHAYVKGDNDTLKVKQYDIAASGTRASEPRDELVFKRQKPN
jgi:hypothetical protein